MAQKVFVSYKYADSQVAYLGKCNGYWILNLQTTVRNYVTYFQTCATQQGIIINKGEPEGLDLSSLSDSVICQKLYNRIYDSTVTVVFISPNMYDFSKPEFLQWIPREISYSLKDMSRSDRTSYSNSLVFVVLPDIRGSYTYYNTMKHFNIISRNIDNGYAYLTTWNAFINNVQSAIDHANQNRLHYKPYKQIL